MVFDRCHLVSTVGCALGLLGGAALVSCGGSKQRTFAPTVTSFSPTSGGVGTSVTLTGTGFSGATEVRFHGVIAPFSVNSATEISTEVPTGATTGPVSVTSPEGTGNSSTSFTVDPPPSAPTVTSFSPISGAAGTSVTILGSGFGTATTVRFGNVATAFTRVGNGQLTTSVPPEAVGLGFISVVNPGGTGTSASTFAVLPSISILNPSTGPVGTPVSMLGTGFSPSSSVTFNGASATVTVLNPTQVIAVVPSSPATSSVVALTTEGGRAEASSPFTITTGSVSFDLALQGAYLTQSTQKLDGSVPLVKDRDALLRVFVTANLASGVIPAVQVRLINTATSAVLKTYTPTFSGASVPTQLAEGNLASSWNQSIPASDIQPGRHLMVDVDPTVSIPEADRSNNSLRIPATGSLDVRTLSPLNITLVPIVVSSVSPNLSDGNMDAYLAYTKGVHPIPSVYQANLHAPYSTNTVPKCDGTDWDTLLGEIYQIRTNERATNNYYGVLKFTFPSGSSSCVIGLGYGGYPPVAIGWDSMPTSAPQTIAHELGHNWGYGHTQCSGEDGPYDDPYPYPNATIGAYGYDTVTGALKDKATYKNLMSYCRPYWISDYSYKKILDYRLAHPLVERTLAAVPRTPSLMIWGSLVNGVGRLEPAYVTDSAILEPVPGDYVLELLDAQGKVLKQVAFLPSPILDMPVPNLAYGFAFTVPLDEALLKEVRGQRVVRNGDLLAERIPTMKALAGRSGVQVVPRAERKPEGVRLMWDADVHPLVVVKDPRNGQILSFARTGDILLLGAPDEVDLIFSDGVRSEQRRIRASKP